MVFNLEKNQHKHLSIGVVIPAKDEEASIDFVISGLRSLFDKNGYPLIDEIVVADNGSKDKTAKIAKSMGAKVVYQPSIGYGHACISALSVLSSVDIIVFIDGDNAFFAKDLPQLLQPLGEDMDFVIGSRTQGHAEKGSLTPQQKWGNQLAVFLVHALWGHQYTDLGPFRAIRREALDSLNMQELTYGWTVEMQIKALQMGCRVCEIPVDTRVRLGQSKISGTLKGTIGAGIGIISTIAKLWRRQVFSAKPLKDNMSCF